jgi:hypothetical protein
MEKTVVGTLLDSFGAFGQFNLGSYYVTSFGSLPSSLKVNLPADSPKDTIDPVLKTIDLTKFSFEPVLKEWRTEEDNKIEDMFDDYAYEFLFKSAQSRMLIQVVCHHRSLEVTFVYDVKDAGSEAWLLKTSHKLHTTYRTLDRPKFKVLIAQDGMFSTEEVETGDFDSIDIGELYSQHYASVKPRQRYRPDSRFALDREADMHRPVAALLAKFAGPVDRVDDPYARLVEPLERILAFLRQKPVLRPLLA